MKQYESINYETNFHSFIWIKINEKLRNIFFVGYDVPNFIAKRTKDLKFDHSLDSCLKKRIKNEKI